jgi:hypothetical protein
MKNIRLVTFFIALFVCSLPIMAQEYKWDERPAGGSNHGTLFIEKRQNGYQVTGVYYVDETLVCAITGTYYPTTGRIKAFCKNKGEEYASEVNGNKLKNKDAFHLDIGKSSTFVAYRSGISGSWRIEQNGNGRTYTGTLILMQEEIKITGTADWDNHQRGKVSGQLYGSNTLSFTIYYSDGLEGYYKATLSNDGKSMVGGTAQSNKGGATVSWTAKKVSP